jgi:hypothetical protein
MNVHTLHEVDTLHLEFCNKFFVVFHGDSTIQVLLCTAFPVYIGKKYFSAFSLSKAVGR